MSNLDRHPDEVDADSPGRPAGDDASGSRPAVEILEPREVPLGGPRAMTVRRTLPQRARSLIGAWCFVDHYGPDEVAESGGMRVPGHPHTGLATVTWMFEGEVEHRDTLGTHLTVRPGEVNLMTSGAGIAHSEFSTAHTTRIHGAQLWLALPDANRGGPRRFENYAAPQLPLDDGRIRVFLGSLAGATSPVETFSPIVGAELEIDAGGTVRIPVDPSFEHGILVDAGRVDIAPDGSASTVGEPAQLVYLAPGASTITVRAGSTPARVLLIGSEPFGESIVMWWNFIGRSHDEIVADRAAWQARVADLAAGERSADDFGDFPEVWEHVLPAPELPTVRLRPRA